MKETYKFTVFTPTYNRAATLPKVYESLKAQTFRDFEWLVVDDGSTDETPALMREWKAHADFPIRYYSQENGGKHRARNRAVKLARGEFFFTWDSDDICVPSGLARMKAQWDNIPQEERVQFAGVTGLCAYSDGSIVGSRFPQDRLDSNMFDIRETHHVDGDKCGFQRTDVMRTYPFPEFEGETFITEAVVWFRISRQYKTRFFNEVIRIVDYRSDGLSAAGIRQVVENPNGKALYFSEYMAMDVFFPRKLKAAANHVRCSLHSGKGFSDLIKESPRPILSIVASPLGLFLYRKDIREYRQLT